MKFRPLHDRIVIKRIEAEAKTAGGIIIPDTAKEKPEQGKVVAAACAKCHGEDGNSATPDYPKLAGQHRDYLAKALRDYKSGMRKNAIMATFAAHLTSAQMDAIADYFAKQQPSLQTLPRPYTSFSHD